MQRREPGAVPLSNIAPEAPSRPMLLTCSGLREMDSATTCSSPQLLFGESHADLLVDSKKYSISDSYLLSFPVTSMTPENRWRNASPLLGPEKLPPTLCQKRVQT